jgi:hypothetical protein
MARRALILAACAVAVAAPAPSAETFNGRWAADTQVCESEDNAMLLLVVTPLLLRWRDAACAVRTSYRVRDAWHIGAQCWGGGSTGNIPIKLQMRGERLMLGWAGAPAAELRRCP